jgi:hypothetical protein
MDDLPRTENSIRLNEVTVTQTTVTHLKSNERNELVQKPAQAVRQCVE